MQLSNVSGVQGGQSLPDPNQQTIQQQIAQIEKNIAAINQQQENLPFLTPQNAPSGTPPQPGEIIVESNSVRVLESELTKLVDLLKNQAPQHAQNLQRAVDNTNFDLLNNPQVNISQELQAIKEALNQIKKGV